MNTREKLILNKFTIPDKEELYKYDPTFHVIVDQICTGVDPILIIEQLYLMINKMSKELFEISTQSKTIYFGKEDIPIMKIYQFNWFNTENLQCNIKAFTKEKAEEIFEKNVGFKYNETVNGKIIEISQWDPTIIKIHFGQIC